MKAIFYKTHGTADVLEYGERPKGRIKSDQALIEVRASSVNPVDWKIRSGIMPFLTMFSLPIVPGMDVAGVVVETGRAVKRFQVGDEVCGMLDPWGGACAEFAAVPESALIKKPSVMSFDEAAAFPLAALTVWQGVGGRAGIKENSRILVNGASGGVGTYAVQIFKALGARVTGVCSAGNADLVKSLGADAVIDYKTADFHKSSETYDIIYDAMGMERFGDIEKLLNEGGLFATTLPSPEVILSMITNVFSSKRINIIRVANKHEDLALIAELIEERKVKSIIDRTFPLEKTADAHRFSEQGRARGKIVIRVS